MDKVGLGFVGLGWWGKRLAEAAITSEEATIVACHARSAASLDAFATQYEARKATEFSQILEDPEVDGVVIATPHTTHADLAVQAIQAGKAVFIEKPMTVSVEAAERVLSAATTSEVVVQVGHNRRKQTANRTIKEMIDKGDLGTIHHVEANMSAPTAYGWQEGAWRVSREELPGGGLTVMGVHMVDTLHYLVGLPKVVFGLSNRPLGLTAVDEATAGLIDFASGPIGYLATSVTIPKVVTVAVFGSDTSVWNEEDGNRLFVQPRGEATRSEVAVTVNDPLVEEMAEFSRCIRTGESPETGAKEGLDAVRTMMAIVDSAANGQPVTFADSGVA